MSRVGSIYLVVFRYYDVRSDSNKYKKRPFLILKEEDGNYPKDLTCLPISKITNRNRRNLEYDIKVSKNKYPKLNLKAEVSFIRCHKIQTINEKDLLNKICDNFKKDYPNLYEKIKLKVQDFYGDIL